MTTFKEFYSAPLSVLPGTVAARAPYYPPSSAAAACSAYTDSLTQKGSLSDQNSALVILRGNKMRTKQAFLDEFSAVLQFPAYFGENWDAFEDCLRDLSWLSATRIVVDFHAPEQILQNAENDFDIFRNIYTRIFSTQKSTDDHSIVTSSVEVRAENISKELRFVLSSSYPPDAILLERWSSLPVVKPFWLT